MATKNATAPILVLPSDEQLAAARADRKAAGTANEQPVGTVLGLPSGYVAAKLDQALDDGTKARLRAKWKSLGWTELEGLHQVVGYPLGCHVFVKREADYQNDRAERDDRMRAMGRNGQMLFGNS